MNLNEWGKLKDQWPSIVQVLIESGMPCLGFDNGIPFFEPDYTVDWGKVESLVKSGGESPKPKPKPIAKKPASRTKKKQ